MTRSHKQEHDNKGRSDIDAGSVVDFNRWRGTMPVSGRHWRWFVVGTDHINRR